MINYALEGPIWTSPVVTWSFAVPGNAAFTGAIDPTYQGIIIAAAAQWSAAANVTLRQVAPGTPGTDITVGWGSFGGTQIGETAYSYNPGTTPAFLPGMTIQFEDPSLMPLSTDGTATYRGTATTLLEVALHEFGHALGLGLSTDPNSIMNIRLGPSNATLNASDLAGIGMLYGTANKEMAASVSGTDFVQITGGNIGIYRFFDSQSGTQFLTSSVGEMNTIFSTRPDLHFEGLGLAGVSTTSNDPNAAPVYRFFDSNNGTHFFTASQSEATTIAATRPDMIAEQPSFDEHVTPEAGDVPIYRFFDSTAGTHFFTASGAERSTIAATRPDMTFEGVAFYAPSTT